MAGIEIIIEKIKSNSDKTCLQILNIAKQDSLNILEKAEQEGKEEYQKILESAKEKAKEKVLEKRNEIQKTSSKTIETAENEAITYAVEAVLKTLRTLEVPYYFALISRLIVKNAKAGIGKLYFNETDLKRLPKKFVEQINQRLTEDKNIVLSEKSMELEDGFFLEYENEQLNCSFKSVLDSNSEEITAIISKIIFPNEEE